MDLLLLALKYAFASLLVWFACQLSHIPVTLVSSFILGAVAAFIEWRWKVWTVEQLSTLQQTTVRGVQAVLTEIRSPRKS
jgi:hypothetical protein